MYIHIPKYENSEICNMPGLTLLNKGYSSSVHETNENTMRDSIGLLSLAVIKHHDKDSLQKIEFI